VRVDVADLRALSGPPIKIHNLSSSGMRFHSPVFMTRGQSAEISLALPGQDEPVELRFVVERQDTHNQGVYRAMFLDLSRAQVSAIEHYVHNTLLVSSQAELFSRYPSLVGKNLQTIREQDRIEQLLRARMVARKPLIITAGDLKVQARVRIKAIDSSRPLMQVISMERIRFRLGATLLLNLPSGNRSYLFESAVVETSGASHTFLRPALIFFADERFDLREPLAPGALTAVISLPYPPDTELRLPVLNRSDGGLALELPAKAPMFNGTPVERIRLVPAGGGPEEEVGPMVVCHVSGHPRGEPDKVLVGMQYSLPRAPLQVGRWDRKTTPVPPSRGTLDGEAHVTLVTPPGEETRAELRHLGLVRTRLLRWEDDGGAEMVGRLDTPPGFSRDQPVPVVVVPPAAVKTKETVVGLSMSLVEGFASVGEQVAVLRYDGTNRRGESYNAHADNPYGQKMLSWNHARGIADLEATLAAVRSGEHVNASHIILVTFSAAGLEARYLLARGGGEVTLWIPILAVPEFREASQRIYGGMDVVDLERLGVLPERLRALGEELLAQQYVKDAVDLGLAGMDQAREDMAAIRCPVYWIAGRDDGWVDFSQVQDLMTIRADRGALRNLFPVESGHQLRTSAQALEVFHMITELVMRHVTPDAPMARHALSPDDVEEASKREQERLQLDQIHDPAVYWQNYLMGDGPDELGYDIMREAEDFEVFMRQQAQLLRVQDGDVVADLGTGTGNLMDALVRHGLGGRRPARLVLSDLVPSALERAERKVRTALQEVGLTLPVEAVAANLEHSRLAVIESLLAGELHGPMALRSKVAGLGESTLTRLAAGYDRLAHRVMRGHVVTDKEHARLQARLGDAVLAYLLELSRAARLVRGVTVPEDLRPGIHREPGHALRTSDLNLDLISFGDTAPGQGLPLPEGAFDCIASSLVICYLNEPARVVRSLARLLRPGGRAVISTPRPDMDISGIFVRLVEGITNRGGDEELDLLASARKFSNSAALLLYLEEQGYFHLPDEQKLCRWMEEAGFQQLDVTYGLGHPPQAIIVSGVLPG